MGAELYIGTCALAGERGHAAGRALLAQLYAAHVGTPLPEVHTQPSGKPYFAGGKWHFSISHTKRHAFCVLADRPVGLDAEEADRNIDLRLADSILSNGEKAQFEAAVDKRRTLLTFWVLKEAKGKLTGKGVGFHPRHTDFVLPDDRVQEIDGCIVAVFY